MPSQFSRGLGTGIGVLVIELLIFAFDTIRDAITNGISTLPSSSVTQQYNLLNFSSWDTLFAAVLILQSIIIGFFADTEFVLGFLIGNGIVLVLGIFCLWNVSSSVVIGMGISFLIALGCFIIKSHLKKPPMNQNEYSW